MAQKGQRQEGMSCGEVRAVCGFHTQGLNVVYFGFLFYLTAVDKSIPLIQNKEQPPKDGMFGSLLAREHSTTHL